MSASRQVPRALPIIATVALTLALTGIAPMGAAGQPGGPTFSADITGDYVSGGGFGGDVTVTIFDPGTGKSDTYGGDEIGYEGGWFTLFLDPSESSPPWDLQAGQIVTVTSVLNPLETKELVTANLVIGGFDLIENTITGTSNQTGTPITVSASHAGAYGSMAAVFDPSGLGAWVADFDLAVPLYDLRVMDQAAAWQPDDDGDSTRVGLGPLAPARFAFGPETQEVTGSDWPDGLTVTLTIDRAPIPGSPDYTATTTAGYWGSVETTLPTGGGNVYFNLAGGPFRAMGGDVMTMSAGTTTKTQTIPNLTMDLPDWINKRVSGRTTVPMPAGSFLTVNPGVADPREVTPLGDGSWLISGLPHFGDENNGASAVQTDVDGDQTGVNAPHPELYVDPMADRVWAPEFTGGSVTLTIERAGMATKTWIVPTQNRIYGGWWFRDMWAQPTGSLPRPTMALFDLNGVFDIQAGDVLTATGGTSTRTATVAYLTVESVSAADDTITGRADSEVTLHLGETGGYWGYGTTALAGQWSYLFDPTVFPYAGLEPGMTGQAIIFPTVVRWTVAYAFGGFFPPVDNRPTLNSVKAGLAVPVRFSLGGYHGLDIFATGYPMSRKIHPPRGTPVDVVEVTVKAKGSSLMYDWATQQYVYVWKTDKAWSGTSRRLVLRLNDGSEYRADFKFTGR